MFIYLFIFFIFLLNVHWILRLRVQLTIVQHWLSEIWIKAQLVPCNKIHQKMSPKNVSYFAQASVNSSSLGQSGCHSHRSHFQTHFREWNILYFNKKFTEVCSYGSNWQWPIVGLDNGSAPNRRQAIIWTNADPIHWRTYAELWGEELINVWPTLHGCVRRYIDVKLQVVPTRNSQWVRCKEKPSLDVLIVE